MSHRTRDIRLRIHAEGTETPTDGTVDFTLGDFADIPRFGGTVIRPTEGKSETTPWRFRCVDTAGIITANLADADGHLDVLGRLAEVQESTDGGAWTTSKVGRLTAASLDDALGAYVLEVSDERWKERSAKPFDAADTANIYPPGLRHWWRGIAPGPVAQAEFVETVGNMHRLRCFGYWPLSPQLLNWIKDDVRENPVPRVGRFEHLRAQLDVDPAKVYEIVTFGKLEDGAEPAAALDGLLDPRTGFRFDAWIYSEAALPAPSQGPSYRFVLYAPTAPPSPALPLHVGTWAPGNPGSLASGHRYGFPYRWTLLRALYDEAGIRYDEARIAALEAADNIIQGWRITSEETSLAEWVEEQIYAASGVVPFVDDNGRVAPRSVRLPDAGEFDPATAFVLNAANLISPPTWDAAAGEAVTVVRSGAIRYRPVTMSTARIDAPGFSRSRPLVDDYPADGVTEEQVVFGPEEATSVDRLGPHERTFKLHGLPPEGEPVAVFAPFGGDPNDRPNRPLPVHRELARLTFDRFGDGPAWVEAPAHGAGAVPDGSGRTPADLVPGDLCILDVASFPNLATGSRGGARVVQIMEREILEVGIRFTCLDAGPNLQPLATPTASVALAADDVHHGVDVTVSAVPVSEAALVELAFGATAEFTRQVVVEGTGAQTTTRVSRLPSGTTIRARARRSAPGRVSSLWSAEDSVATTALTAPAIASDDGVGRTLFLSWTVGEPEYGVEPVYRIPPETEWTVANPDPLPPLSTRFAFHRLAASTTYEIGVRHVDPYGGASAVAFVSRATAAAGRTLEEPRALQVLQGRAGGAGLTAGDLPDEELVVGYGIEVGWTIREPHALSVIQVSTDPGFASFDELQVAPGVDSSYVFLELDEVERHIRILHEREGFQDSPPSAVVSAKPTALLQSPRGDQFAGGYAELDVTKEGNLGLQAGHGDDPDTDRLYYGFEVNPADETVFPGVDEASAFLERADLPFSGAIPVGAPQAVQEGDLVLLTARFWNSITGFGQETRDKLVIGRGFFVDAQPVLDEDDSDLYLYPNRTPRAGSVYYLVTDTADPAPDAAAVIAGANRSSDDEILVHQFADPGAVRVSVVAVDTAAGAHTVEGPVRHRRWTFSTADDGPVVSWFPFVPVNPANEGVRFIARDDGTTVEFGHAVITEGDPVPAWPGDFTLTGQVSDPATVEVEVSKPAEGAPDKLIYFQAQDAEGNLASDEPQIIRVDANAIPDVRASLEVDPATGHVWVTPERRDSDTGSYRLDVAVAAVTADAHPALDGSGVYEKSGTDFGTRYRVEDGGGVPLVVAPTQAAFLTLQGYRTTATTLSAQQASISMPEPLKLDRARNTGGDPTGLEILAHRWYKFGSTSQYFYRIDLRPWDTAKSVHAAVTIIAGGSGNGTANFDINSRPASTFWNLEVGLVAGSPDVFDPAVELQIVLTPYDATGGAAGGGTAGTSVTLETGAAGAAAGGRMFTQAQDDTQYEVDAVAAASGKGVQVDASGELIAKPDNFVTASTSGPSGTPATGAGSIWAQYIQP